MDMLKKTFARATIALLGFFIAALLFTAPHQVSAVILFDGGGSAADESALAPNKGCADPAPSSDCGGSRTIEHRCAEGIENVCSVGIETREHMTSCTRSVSCSNGKWQTGQCSCSSDYSAWTMQTPGKTSAICAGGSTPSLQCAGKCYIPPTLKELSDETLQPKNVFNTSGEGDTKKPKLPLVLGWQDDAAKQIAADQCAVGSYAYAVSGQAAQASGTAGAGELQTMVKDCRLLPNASYTWKVKTCIDSGGKDCGEWSREQKFSTSSAPEPKSPFDPDFEGVKNGISDLPVTLRWCPSPSANAYKVNIINPNGTVADEQLFEKHETFYSDFDLFKVFYKGMRYIWSVFSCGDLDGTNCKVRSQQWSVVPISELDVPTNLRSKIVVNLEDSLEWDLVPYAPFYMVRIEHLGTAQDSIQTTNSLPLGKIWNKLQNNSVYSWKVAACASDDVKGSNCTAWSAASLFQTTGAPPQNLAASPSENNLVGIPFTLTWDAQEGALSYAYEIAPDQTFSALLRKGIVEADQYPKVEIAYQGTGGQSSIMRPGQTYYARITTCADRRGIECGQWTILSVATAPLKAPDPISPLPSQGAYTPKVDVAWKKALGQNYYAYRVFYEKPSSEEKNASCLHYQHDKPVSEGITNSSTISYTPSCVGIYKAEVTPCTDNQCAEKGISAVWNFQVTEPAGASSFFGLVPCSRAKDNTATSWNERESCQFKHSILFVHNMFNFLLWQALPALVVLYAIFSGAIFYFSLGNPGVLMQIKSIWKAIGIGFIIVFFSWMFINLFLGILGFNINIFGRWYELKL